MDLLVAVSKEQPGTMTDKDIREEVDTFMFEGHDTSSIAMTMALIHLGLDKNIQVSHRNTIWFCFVHVEVFFFFFFYWILLDL